MARGITAESVRKRVERIRGYLYDSERVHAEEDRIHLSVLKAIARGHDDPRGLAREAIKTEKIDVPRWYA